MGVLLASVWSFSQIYMAETTGSFVTGEGAFVSTALAAWACLVLAVKLAPLEYATLFAVVEGASASSALLPALVGLPIVLALPSDLNWGNMLGHLPPLLAPDQFVASFAILGGAPIPTGRFLPSLLYVVLVNSVIWISLSAQMFLLRERLYSLKTISYPVPSAAHFAVRGAVDGERATAPTMLLGFLVGFLLVSLTQGYLSSALLADFFLIPAGLTGPIYDIVKGAIPGSLLGLDILSNIPYIWFLLFVPSSVSATVSLSGAIFYMLILPIEFQLKVIPNESVQSYATLFSASRTTGLSSLWIGIGLLVSSSLGIFFERAKVTRLPREKLSASITALVFVVPPVLLAWALGGNVFLMVLILAMSLLSISAWSSRGLGELNVALAPSEVIMSSSWPIARGILGVSPLPSRDSVSFFLGGYLSAASSIGPATSLESVKFGELLGQGHSHILSYFILGSLVGLVLGPIFYLWLLFRFGVQSRMIGGQVLGMVEHATGIYSARAHLVDGVSPLNVDPISLLLGAIFGLGVPLLANSLFGLALSPYAMAIGVYLSPAGTIIPYALISVLRYLLLERPNDENSSRKISIFFVGLASGAMVAALLSTVLSTLL